MYTNFSIGGAPGSNLKFNMQKVSYDCLALGRGLRLTAVLHHLQFNSYVLKIWL